MEPKDNSFLSGAILPSLLKFSIPVLLALMLQALYGAVDLWAVGKFATTGDISAVATGSQAMCIITGLITGLAMGTTVLLGMRVGSQDAAGAAEVVGSSMWIFGVLGVLLTVSTVLAAPWLATVTNAPPEAFPQTVRYIRICGSGSLFIVAYNVISAVFRGIGDSRSPLFFVLIACVTNIIGDVLLIDLCQLGAAGAAIATVAAQAVSVLLSLFLIRRNGLSFPFTARHIRPCCETIRKILWLGTPIALQSVCNEISFLILIGFVNALGAVASAGVGIAEKLVMFILLIPMSYMQSISAFVAQNIGAGQPARARRSMWLGMATAAALGGMIACITFFHGDLLATLFVKSSEAEVIAAAAEFLKATSIECFLLSIAYCFTGYFNGVGRTTFVMMQGLLSTFLVRIPWAWYASRRPQPRLFEIGLSAAFAALSVLLLCVGYYLYRSRRDMLPD